MIMDLPMPLIPLIATKTTCRGVLKVCNRTPSTTKRTSRTGPGTETGCNASDPEARAGMGVIVSTGGGGPVCGCALYGGHTNSAGEIASCDDADKVGGGAAFTSSTGAAACGAAAAAFAA